jgi:hypothetical protein
MEAYTAAVADGMRTWSERLERTDWQSRVAAVQDDARQAEDAPGRPPLFPQFGYGASRSLTELTEEILGALSAVRAQVDAPAPTGVGRDGSGSVSLTISRGGLQACTVQAAWAARQSADGLARALNEALRAAHADLAERYRQQQPPARVDELLNEALAALNNMRADMDTLRRDNR